MRVEKPNPAFLSLTKERRRALFLLDDLKTIKNSDYVVLASTIICFYFLNRAEMIGNEINVILGVVFSTTLFRLSAVQDATLYVEEILSEVDRQLYLLEHKKPTKMLPSHRRVLSDIVNFYVTQNARLHTDGRLNDLMHFEKLLNRVIRHSQARKE